jgi:hypothetical protein
LKQKRLKKEELNKLYLKGNKMNKNREKIDENPSFNILNQLNENDFINKEKKDSIQIEFSNGEIIKEEIITLTKYPNSVLSACINGKISLPKRNGHFFR